MSTPTEALDICADIVERARAAGADEVEAYFESSTNRTVDARKGQLESITTAGARGVGVRVLIGGALGFASGSDLDAVGRTDLAEQAVWLARASAPDGARLLADPAPDGQMSSADLAIYDPAVAGLTVDEIVALLTRTEQAAFAVDPRIADTHIERFGQTVEQIAIVNSRGIALSTQATSCYLSLSIIARQDQISALGTQSAKAGATRGTVSAMAASLARPAHARMTGTPRRLDRAHAPRSCGRASLTRPWLGGS